MPSREAPPAVLRSAVTVLVLLVLAAGVLTGCAAGGRDGVAGAAPAPSPSPGAAGATGFLDTYVDDDGRVVRHDQGGDTVSEGQAYGMLAALLARDRERFDRVWAWTQEHLARPDGLYSWHWRDGGVVDASSAADAEVDMARALVVAADVFGDDAYRASGVAVGRAVLDHETVAVPEGRLLVAGEWATRAPYAVNASYVSPVTATLLGRASGDPRWSELAAGSRAAVAALVSGGQLPPDWAEVEASGAVRAVPGPDGSPPQYGYDAARTLLRHAESCDPADHRIAAQAAQVVGRSGGDPVARYDLDGGPLTGDPSPLVTVAQAAGLAAAGDVEQARAMIDLARRQQQEAPTYYGDAWTVLGPALLSDPVLGGCPPLA